MLAPLSRWLKSSLITIAFLFVFLIALEIQSPRFFGWDDNATYFSGAYQYNYDSLIHQKTFPWMVWTQYAGQTNLTQSQSGVLYLPAYLATGLSWLLFKSSLWNIDLLVITHLLFGAWGMIRFLRFWKLPPEVCNAVGLLYGTTPFFILVSKSWIFVAYSMAYTPWLFLGIDRLFSGAQRRDIATYILLKSLFFFQGYSQAWINLSFIEGLYFLLRCRFHFKYSEGLKTPLRMIGLFTIIQIIHLLLILPQLAVNIQSVQNSPFRNSKIQLDQLLAFKVDFADGLLAQFFYFQSQRYLDSSSSILMMGGSLILFFFIYQKLRSRENWSSPQFISLTFLTLTALLSTYFYSLLSFLPPFHILRWPIKWMMLVPFFYGITFAFFLKSNHRTKPSFHWILFLSAFAQMSVVLIPSHQSPFSNLRTQSQTELKIHWPYRSGRALPISSDQQFLKNPQMLSYNYGTATGVPTLGGYDQLISKKNLKIALEMQITGALDIERIGSEREHLNRWGVRYLITSFSDPKNSILNLDPSFTHFYEDQTIIVWENKKALPLISTVRNPVEPIEFKMTPQSISFVPPLTEERITFRFAPQNNLRYRYQQREKQSPWYPLVINTDLTQQLSIPENCSNVEIRYCPKLIDISFFVLSETMILFLLLQFSKFYNSLSKN